MASQTPHLGLKLLGTSLVDKAKYFEDWRQDINGEEGTSNMTLIDNACLSMHNEIEDIHDDIDELQDYVDGVKDGIIEDIDELQQYVDGIKDGIITDAQIDALFNS